MKDYVIQLDTMINPDGCQGGWLILPDTDKHAVFIQSALLTAKSARSPVQITVSGCFQNYPRIIHMIAN